jgi:carboxymethylenebutenolidase
MARQNVVFSFTHNIEMDWMLPGIRPTHRKVEVPFVVVVQFQGDQIACERVYWDQASVLVQIGVLDPAGCPSSASNRPASSRTINFLQMS